ncbi:LysR family transcriptional regulator [Providencia stuartii]|uniref:LysR family transcriptional regulator n=1 Tax=Providencia stuartii TaxID=588 RepID=UPI0024B15E23
MNIRFLETFLCIVEEGSVASAARKLHLTATAMAQRIKALEDEIGVALLYRTGRTMQVTPEGKAILPKVRELIAGSKALKQLALMQDVAGELRIGVLPTLLSMLVPDVLTHLNEQFPQLVLSIELGFSSGLYRQLANDEIDLALLVTPLFPLSKEYCRLHHHQEKFVVVAPATLKGRTAHDLLKTEPFIRYHQQSWGGIVADRYLQSQNIQVNKRFDLNTLDAIVSLVSSGCGISLIPDWQPLFSDRKNIIKFPLPEPAPSRDIGILYKYNSAKKNLIAPVIEQLFLDKNEEK